MYSSLHAGSAQLYTAFENMLSVNGRNAIPMPLAFTKRHLKHSTDNTYLNKKNITMIQ